MKHRKLIVVLAAVALLFGVTGWLAGTTSGLRFVVALALPHVPLTLDSARTEGRLVGPLSLGGLELEGPGVRGTIERIDLDWQPSALLGRTLHLRRLHIEAPHLQVDTPPAPEDAPARPLDVGRITLPLSLVLERLSLSDGAASYDGRPIVTELELALSGRAEGRRLALADVRLRSGQGAITGHARASLAPADPWDIDLAWQFDSEQGPVAGRTRIVGSLADLAVEQGLTEPFDGRVEGTLRGLPGAPSWNLGLVIDSLPEAAGRWPESLDGASARLRLEGRLDDSLLSGQIELPALVPGRVDVEAQAGWQDGIATIRRLVLELADGGTLRGSGQLTPGEALAAEFTLEGTDLGWPPGEAVQELGLPRLSLQGSGAAGRWQLNADGLARREGLPDVAFSAALDWAESVLGIRRLELDSPDGEIRATASGTLDLAGSGLDYRVDAEADIALPEYPPLSLRLMAAGDAHGVDIETLAAQLLDGTLDGAGRITWAGDRAADFRLAFADLDPASLAPDWPGRLAGTLELRGMPTTEDGLEITLSSLGGELRSLPVSGAGALNVSGATFQLRRTLLEFGSTSLEASGRLDEAFVRLDAKLAAPSLEELNDEVRGDLAATVHVDGARATPVIALDARGASLRWQGARARAVRVEAHVDLSGAEASRIVAEVERFATAPGPGAGLRLEADGTPEDHRIRLELAQAHAGRTLSLGLAGGLADTRWTGQLTALAIAEADREVWALQGPAALGVGADRASLDGACMAGTLGRMCVDADWNRGGPWSGHATLAELDLEPLSEWLGMGLIARGVLAGEVIVEAAEGRFSALSGGLELSAGDIRLAAEDSAPLLAWETGTLELDGDASEARAKLRVPLAEADLVDGQLRVGWNAADPPLDGQLEAKLGQLQLLTELLPDLADLEGHATVQASLSGTLSAPILLGHFELLDGTAQIPTLGLQPDNVNLLAELEAGILTFKATGRSGDGTFEADGRFDLGADAVEGRASLTGEGVLVANLPEARITASPDLRLSYSGRELVINGAVTVPFARISGTGGPSAIATSQDEVIVGSRARARDEGLSVWSRIRVSVGPDVQVQASGLRGQVEGSLLTVTEPQALPWGRGELRVVDGTFSTFGQRLEIDTGRLIYTGGPLENPGLEIRAVRRVDDITAGALVRGTLQEPEISVYSDPALPRAEALSYLTLGKPLDELQAGEQNTLNQAASSLALSGGGLIARDLGRRLGFDDVSVSADDDTGGASVVVSKYLGSGLYVSYGLGLFDTMNTLRLRYQVNSRLSLEATSGEESAGDLFYTFERD